MALQEKIERLFNLLDDVEQGITSDPSLLSGEVAKHLAERLHEVANLVDKRCIEASDEPESDLESDLESEPAPPPPAGSPASAQVPMFRRPQLEVLDEPAKKRRHEAEVLVRALERPKTFSCGVAYTGDEKERDYTKQFKEELKRHMPALKNHMHIFRYMAWATVERFECPHCRLCKNEP